MTDAKQALEVVERLREGAGRVARHCMRQAEHGDPGLISIPRHERDIDAIMEQAASLLSSLAEENERLRGAMRPFLTLARAVTVDGSPDFVHWAREAKDWVVAFSFAGHSVSIGDLRALTALTTHPAQPEGEGHDH